MPNSVPRNLTPDQALERLIEANRRFVAGHRTPFSLLEKRASHEHGQHPYCVVLGCADSRFPPKLAFDAPPGELFIVRVAGNIVNSDGLASIEYATEFLNVPLVVVLGHSDCGAVHAAIEVLENGTQLPGRLPGLIDQITPAVRAAKESGADNLMEASATENVRRSVAALRNSTPVLHRRISNGDVRVVGGMYHLVSGEFIVVDP